MLKSEEHKHYYLHDKFILGEKWMDHKGIVWTIDDIQKDFIIIEGEVDDRHILKQLDISECNDFLNFKIC